MRNALHRRDIISNLVLFALAAALGTSLHAEEVAQPIRFQKELDILIDELPWSKPTVVSFGSNSCGWCRKMKVTTFKDPGVEAIASRYQWVAVDVDKQPDIAARYQVQGLPATLLLDADGNVTHHRFGYMPAERFMAFLAGKTVDAVEIVEPTATLLEKIRDADENQLPPIVAEMIGNLANPQRADRQRILAELAKRESACAPLLVEHLSHRHLAIRAAAAEALRFVTGEHLPFNAFAPADEQQKDADAWHTHVMRQ